MPRSLANKVTQSSTDSLQYTLGEEYEDFLVVNAVSFPLPASLAGMLVARRWRWVKNTSGAAWTRGTVVERVAATAGNGNGKICVTVSTPRDLILGVAQNDVAANSGAWIQFKGLAAVRAGGSVTADDSVKTNGTTGQVDTVTRTTLAHVIATIGIALESDGAADSLIMVNLDIP